ncbi:MAG: hypothetical protein WA981_00885 [Glaciecola sp.]
MKEIKAERPTPDQVMELARENERLKRTNLFRVAYTLATTFFCGMAIERGDYFVASVCVLAGVVCWWILSDQEQD